jgi:hypothetical protein
MALLPVGTYLKFMLSSGAVTGISLQNFHQNETRNFDGLDYVFANFAFSGSTVDASATNITASIVMGVNAASIATMNTAVLNRWYVAVRTVWLDPDTLDEANTWLEEVYAVTNLTHDTVRMNVELGSPLNAITTDLPRRVLTHALVGNLPPSGAAAFG